MGRDKPTVAPSALTSNGRLPACLWPTSQGRPDLSGYWCKEASMDGFIDEIITITIDGPWWVERTKNVDLLIIHTIFRPRQSNKPLKWYDPLSLRKLAGEVQLSQCKTCLGWVIQTRSLRVFLPVEKYTAWVHDIRASLAITKINTYKLESLIGELNHAAHIVPPARYLLNRLRNLLNRGKKWGPQRLHSCHRQDLQLWMKILQWVRDKGVLINNIIFTIPTVTLWSDTCKYGIGGYNDKGMAWLWYIPPE